MTDQGPMDDRPRPGMLTHLYGGIAMVVCLDPYGETYGPVCHVIKFLVTRPDRVWTVDRWWTSKSKWTWL